MKSVAVRSVELVHPKRRDGTSSTRAFASATLGHAFFGIVVGPAVRDPEG